MKLYTIQSGSNGNCTILTDNDGNQLIFDCGVKYEKIFTYCNIPKVNACLVTHEHKDHSLSMSKLARSGMDIYSWETVSDGKTIEIGQWLIVPMELKHNVPCFGFLVYNKRERKKFAYITDTTVIPNIPNNMDCVMIECNYDETIVQDRLMQGESINLGCRNHLSIGDIEEWAKSGHRLTKRLILAHTSSSGLISKYAPIERLQAFSIEPIEIAVKDFSAEF